MKVLTTEQSSAVQRTYRYLRVGIAATVAVIFVAIAVATIEISQPLRSVSAYYYTSAQGPFVGALIAASLGIIAISGRGAERAFFDAAGVVAPLIALIPTQIDNSTIPGYAPCPGATECVPEQFHAGIGVGVVTYGVIGIACWIAALFFTRRAPRTTGLTVSLVTTPAILLAAPVLFFVARDVLLTAGHIIAAGAFFLLIALVAMTDSFESDVEKAPTRRVQRSYRIIGVIMGVDVVATIILVVAGLDSPAFPVGFIGEMIALALFFAFWILQSRREWADDDQSYTVTKKRTPTRPRTPPENASAGGR